MTFALFIALLAATAILILGKPIMRFAYVIGYVARKIIAVLWLVLLLVAALMLVLKIV